MLTLLIIYCSLLLNCSTSALVYSSRIEEGKGVFLKFLWEIPGNCLLRYIQETFYSRYCLN